MMTDRKDHKLGKWEKDENFPVASFLISSHQRPALKAFYRFARSADDAADNPSLNSSVKLQILDKLEKTLLGKSDEAPDALPLRSIFQERGLSTEHAQHLLVAFRQDVIKDRYNTWDELINYCNYSANPVGRFILDIHGEDTSSYPYSDTLCTTLQIINHLQDCKKDYFELNRIYIPLSEFLSNGISINELSKNESCPSLLKVFKSIIDKTINLEPNFEDFSCHVKNKRLSLEISVISKLANRLIGTLMERDPLKDRVHLNKRESILVAVHAAYRHVTRRYFF
ncbi:MAG: squalene/phytoene synthase family protein [Hyphomicrobium sp.]